jgi:hypothetical protein
MREINYGPVWDENGNPTEITKNMLAGTGRLETEFAHRPHNWDYDLDRDLFVCVNCVATTFDPNVIDEEVKYGNADPCRGSNE